LPLVALVYPPTSDPTAPYLSVPMLAGFLRAHGVDVLPVDANVEAFDLLLEPGSMARVRDRIEARLAELETRASLAHEEQLEYAALWRARGDAHAAADGVLRAKATLRDPIAFYDPEKYAAAVGTLEAALRAISAAHHPLHLDFTAYRTPFALTNQDEIAADAAPGRDPFDDYVTHTLIPRLAAAKPDVIGLSVCFPGQLQPAYAFAIKLKRAFPNVHVTVGGPAITQILLRLKGQALARALGPFDSAVVFEGEHSLLALVRALEEKRPLRELTNVVLRDALLGARYLPAHGMEDMKALPSPDYDGMPLALYFTPAAALTLPYDPTRGCYWGKCTFCHYGLAEIGTATYRERPVSEMVEHLRALSLRYGTRHFYLSQDSVAPKTLLKLAHGIIDAGLDIKWATDLKPEKYLTADRAQTLRRAGAVACALGVESASPRVLALIDKGAPIEAVHDVVTNLARAGIAPEAMCFTEFPTETADEAMATLAWLDELRDELALFIVGEFDLTHGALVAQEPAKYGIADVWQLEGDEIGTGLFYEEVTPSKKDDERARIDVALARLSQKFRLRHYPWAGAVSTAHTVLYYERFGRGAFRDLARAAKDTRARIFGHHGGEAMARFDLAAAADAERREAAIWQALVFERRQVSRAAYAELASEAPALTPRPRRYRFTSGEAPNDRGKVIGRRPSSAPNSLP
jgi:anaerobic magnesium-protoporphyrin IX monomethyl ester cyclase